MFKKLTFFLSLSFSLCFFRSSPGLASPIPAHQKVKTLQTPHFEIMYYAEQQELAELYARQFERAYQFLDGVFLSKPDKITVVLNDSLDQANGFATRIPYPLIMLYPVMPDLNDTISEFETWSLELATHELTHVLQFEPATGLIGELRKVFGTIIAPNLLMPSWWKEGMGVWSETAITARGGRLRSIYQESMLRSWVGERDFLDFTIGQANETLPQWPWGSRSYLFGSLTMSHLIEKYGESSLKRLIEGHGSAIPYLYDRVTLEATQKSYEQLYEESQISWENRARRQINELSEIPFDQPVQITLPEVLVRSPSVSADGRSLVWVGQLKKPFARLRLSNLGPQGQLGKIEDLAFGEIREARFFPKSNRILFNEIRPANQAAQYSDLFIYDLDTRQKQRLTHNLRGREAQVNSDETEIAFVGLGGGRTSLQVLDLRTQKTQVLFTSPFDERIASPTFLNDKEILYSLTQNGRESLFVFNRATQNSKPLLSRGQRLRRPLRVGSDIWVMSDLNRVFNLYQIESPNRSQSPELSAPKTHVRTTIWDYAVNPVDQSVFAVLMTGQGPRLFYFPPEMLSKSVKSLPMASALVTKATALEPIGEVKTTIEPVPRPYKLWPHYWIPFVSGSTATQGALLSLSTSGSDPSFQHNYQVGLLYDTGVQKLSYNFNYINRSFSQPWALQSTRIARILAGSTQTYFNEAHAFTVLPDTSRLSINWATSLSYVYAKNEQKSVTYERQGPQLGFLYSSARQTLWGISPEDGQEAQVQWNFFNESQKLAAYNQYRLRGATYLSTWLPEHHVLSLEGRAVVTDRKIPSLLGDSSTIFPNALTSSFAMRGYLEGHFIGRNIYNTNLEYRFPMISFSKARGLFPVFLRAIHGAMVMDSITLDGFAYRSASEKFVAVKTGSLFSSAGLELKADTTVGYILPLQFVLGLHSAFNRDYYDRPQILTQLRSNFSF
jgi:hypothetical protein